MTAALAQRELQQQLQRLHAEKQQVDAQLLQAQEQVQQLQVQPTWLPYLLQYCLNLLSSPCQMKLCAGCLTLTLLLQTGAYAVTSILLVIP